MSSRRQSQRTTSEVRLPPLPPHFEKIPSYKELGQSRQILMQAAQVVVRQDLDKALRKLFKVHDERMYNWLLDDMMPFTGMNGAQDINYSVRDLLFKGDIESRTAYMTLKKKKMERPAAEVAEEAKQIRASIKRQKALGQIY